MLSQIAAPEGFRQTSRDGKEAWFDHANQSFHVYIEPWRERCHAHIYSALGNGHSVSGRCSNKGSLQFGGLVFCGGHYPPTVVERKAKRAAVRKAEAERQSARWDEMATLASQKEAALVAIKRIAAGHNDPRGLAMEVLSGDSESPHDP